MDYYPRVLENRRKKLRGLFVDKTSVQNYERMHNNIYLKKLGYDLEKKCKAFR